MNCNTQQGKGARGGSLRQRSGTFQRKGNTLREMTYLTSKNFFYLTCLAVNISRGVHAQYWRPRVSYVKWTLSLDPRPSTHKYTFREQMLLDFIEVNVLENFFLPSSL
uniref:Uncharacterized protein n=1 Tax=Coccidioides posadasii RMSCC 3488 TaxID=454284 RepID=A0A0J6F6E6_COCPO|nr:hypothetical protein CPAG_04838 [Coccidioides posadasii RMSCC 3488]